MLCTNDSVLGYKYNITRFEVEGPCEFDELFDYELKEYIDNEYDYSTEFFYNASQCLNWCKQKAMLIEYANGCYYDTTSQCGFAMGAIDERFAAESDTLDMDICWKFELGNFSLPFR